MRLRKSEAVASTPSPVLRAAETTLSRKSARRRLPRSGSSKNISPVPSPNPAPSANPVFITFLLPFLHDAQIADQQTFKEYTLLINPKKILHAYQARSLGGGVYARKRDT